MKRIVVAFFTCMAAMLALSQTPAAMIDKCVTAINASGGATADYSITTAQEPARAALPCRATSFVSFHQTLNAGMMARLNGLGLH